MGTKSPTENRRGTVAPPAADGSGIREHPPVFGPRRWAWLVDWGIAIITAVVAVYLAIRFAGAEKAYPIGLFFAVSVAASYGLFRLAMNRWISLACAAAFMISPMHLSNLIEIYYRRDYVKAPFIIAVGWLMGALVVHRFHRGRAMAISVACGAVIGLSLHYRIDGLLFAVPFAAVLLCFVPGRFRKNIFNRILCVVVFGTTLLGVSRAVRWDQGLDITGCNLAHGLICTFDARMGLTEPYDLGKKYLDEMVFAIIGVHEVRPALEGGSYDFFFRVLRTLPADMMTRTYAAILRIMELPFERALSPFESSQDPIPGVYAIRATVLNMLAGSGIWLFLATTAVLSLCDLRKSAYYLFAVAVFAGYPVLLFQGRHYFHLEILGLWNLGFVIQAIVRLIRRILPARWVTRIEDEHIGPTLSTRVRVRRAAIFSGAALGIILLPLFLLRQLQQKRLEAVYAFSEEQLDELAFEWVDSGEGRLLARQVAPFEPARDAPLTADYLLLEFRNRCNVTTIWPVIRYSGSQARPDFSRTLTVNMTDSPSHAARVIFPAYYSNELLANDGGRTQYVGIELPENHAACLSRICRIRNREKIPLLLTMAFPPGEAGVEFTKKMTASFSRRLYVPHIGRQVPAFESSDSWAVSSVGPDDVAVHDEIVSYDDGVWKISGFAKVPSDVWVSPQADRSLSRIASTLFADVNIAQIDTDLLVSRPRFLLRGEWLVVDGHLSTGAVSIGLIKGERTAGYATIVERGDFRVAIQAQEDGEYVFGVSNYLDWCDRNVENRCRLENVRWVVPTATASP